MRSIAVANQKGGVGKTTTAVHLAHGLALAGDRVALFDLDPQGHATLAVQAMGEAAERDAPADASRPLQPLGEALWLLPSPGAYRNVARDARVDAAGLVRLVQGMQADFDWLLIDCPPRMDVWGWTGLQLCQQVLIPVQAEFFAMQGLSHMMQTLEQARREFPGHAELLGVVVTMLDVREPVARDVLVSLRSNLGTDLFESLILRDAQLVEAASHGISLFEYNLFSKGARSYAELVREVMHGREATR